MSYELLENFVQRTSLERRKDRVRPSYGKVWTESYS